MVVSALPFSKPASVAVLFPPESVPVIDIFRALGDFEEHYDISSLDELESRLARIVSRDVAKGIVSDALLLAFGLRRERMSALAFAPLRSRRGTLDEYRLLALLGATYWHDFVLASEAAAALEVAHAQPLVSRHSISRAGSKRPDCGSKLQTRAFFACRRPHPSRCSAGSPGTARSLTTSDPPF